MVMVIGLVSSEIAAYQGHYMKITSEVTFSAPNSQGSQPHALLVLLAMPPLKLVIPVAEFVWCLGE